MRHQVAGRKLGRTTSHRKAMFRNMVVSLIEKGRIKTTLQRAKELRKIADNLVSLGKENTLHAKRQAFDLIRDRRAVQKLFSSIAPAFKERKGGYTRIFHEGNRHGDAAAMAFIEYLKEDLLSFTIGGGNAKAAKKNVKVKKAKKAKEKKEASASVKEEIKQEKKKTEVKAVAKKKSSKKKEEETGKATKKA